MNSTLRNIVTSTLYRILETEPSLTMEEAHARTLKSAIGFDEFQLNKAEISDIVADVASDFFPRAVLNPKWLADQHKQNFHFYLVNSQPGWLGHIVDHTNSLSAHISHFILYGIWDSMLVLCGTDPQASELLNTMRTTTFHDLSHFTSRNLLRFHRYNVHGWNEESKTVKIETLEKLVGDYNCDELQEEKLAYADSGVILGPTWSTRKSTPDRVEAFVGITLRGGSHALQNVDVLKSLLSNDILRISLVHLFEIDKGYPFHFVAKLICKDLDELDKATDAISFGRIGRVGMEGNTFIVSSGKELLPNGQNPVGGALRVSLDLGQIEGIASEVLTELWPDALAKFNKLDGNFQLLTLRSLTELFTQARIRSWDEEREESVRSSIENFTRTVLEAPEQPRMGPAVMEVATGVESYCKHMLRRIVDIVYNGDYSKAQKKLKLPTRDFRKLTLGKTVSALRELKGLPEFSFLVEFVTVEWVETLEHFTEIRNKWAHGVMVDLQSSEKTIDDARRAICDGIDILRWIGTLLSEAVIPREGEPTEVPMIELKEAEQERSSGIFLSHSSMDRDTAQKIASVLQALNYDVWYSDWEIKPGESIVQKINEGLAKNDTLIVVLSPNSVKSNWVKKELNSAVMMQLSGKNIRIIPVLIEKCDIPATLEEIKYVDMKNFQAGIIELLDSLG